MGRQLLADAGDGDQQLPLAWRNGSGNIGGRGIARPEREMVLVAAALAAEAVRIVNAGGEGRLFLSVCVAEVDRDAMNSGGHQERNEEMCMVLGNGDIAFQNYIRFLCLRPQSETP